MADEDLFNLSFDDPEPTQPDLNAAPDLNVDPNAPAGETPEQKYARKIAEMEARDHARQEEVERLRAQNERFSSQLGSQPSVPPTSTPGVDMAALKKQLGDQLITDPGEFALRVMQAAQQAAADRVSAATGPLAAGNVTQAMRAYRSDKAQSDPNYKIVEEEFMKALGDPNLAGSLASLTDTQLQATLDFVYDAATGRAARASMAKRRQQPVPPYGEGEVVPGGSPLPTTLNGQKLNKTQQAVLQIARESGIKDPARIKAMLADAEEE